MPVRSQTLVDVSKSKCIIKGAPPKPEEAYTIFFLIFNSFCVLINKLIVINSYTQKHAVILKERKNCKMTDL